MRGDKTIRILQALKNTALDSKSLFEVFLSAGYGASLGKMKYLMRAKDKEHKKDKALFEEFMREKQKFHNFIYYLKSDGIISETTSDSKKWYHVAEKGKRKLLALLISRDNIIPLPHYPKISNNTFTIIAFDIPEKEKKKREWLRTALGQLGYKAIQRSVLLGKTKIPQAFLNDLNKLRMIEYVEIFEITKTGSLRHLI